MLKDKYGIAVIVTHVNPLSPSPTAGGAERFVSNLIKVYSLSGLTPLLVTISEDKHFRTARIEGGLVISIPALPVGFVGLPLYPGFTLRLLARLIKQAKVVHVIYPETPIALLTGLLGKLLEKRIITSSLAFVSWLFHHNKLVRVPAIFTTGLKFLVTRMADLVHVASLHDKYYVTKVNENVYLIPHGINKIVMPEVDRACGLDGLGDKLHGKKIVTFLGRFTPAKGAFVLLDAIYLLMTRYGVKVNLLIIGSRYIALRSLLMYARRYPDRYAKVRDNIVLAGYVSEDVKYALLRLSDVGVIPSLSDPVEAFSYALSEFNHAGVKVVGCLVGSLKTRLLPCAGVGIKPCKPEILASVLAMVLNDSYKAKASVCRLPDVIDVSSEIRYFKNLVRRHVLNNSSGVNV